MRVEAGMSRTNHVIFQFRHPPAALGLDVGVGSQEAQRLAAKVHAGDTLTIYYDASASKNQSAFLSS